MILTAIVGGMRQRVKRDEEQRRKTIGVSYQGSPANQRSPRLLRPSFFCRLPRGSFSFLPHLPPTAGYIFYLNI